MILNSIMVGVVFRTTPARFVYHNKNKPPAMPVSPQIALASRKDLL